MRHRFTTINSPKPYYGRYERLYRILGWIFSAGVLFMLILRFIPDNDFLSFKVRVIFYLVFASGLLALFVARMITDKTVEWSNVVVIVGLVLLSWMDISNAGGWSAVFH